MATPEGRPQGLARWTEDADDDDGFADFEAPLPSRQQQRPASASHQLGQMAKYQEAEDNDEFMDEFVFGNGGDFALGSTTGSTVDMHQVGEQNERGGPRLLKLEDLSKFGYSLDDLNQNNMAFNHDAQTWEGGDEDDEFDFDLPDFGADEVRSRRPFQDTEADDDDDDWENAFESQTLQLPGAMAQSGRAQSASSQGFIPHEGGRLAPLTLPKASADARSENSSMVFNQETLCWEGGEVDMGGFDTDSEGYTGHEDNWDNDFDDEDGALRDRLAAKGTGITDLLSKVFRRGGNGAKESRGTLTLENVNRHKAKHPQRPILITPEDVNMTLYRANSRISAFSDDISGMDESDNTSHNNDEEDWNEGLEGELDMMRIGRLTNDERMIVVPLGGPAFDHSPAAKHSSGRLEPTSTNARGRSSPIPSRQRPTLTRTQKKHSQRTLIRPGEKSAPPVTDMVLDETALVWREKGRAPIDLDDEKTKSHKRGTPSAASDFVRQSLLQEFALTEDFCAVAMTSEKLHNACIRGFLGDADYQRMISTGARRLAETTGYKFNSEVSNRYRRSIDAADDVSIGQEISKSKVAAIKASNQVRPTSATGSEHSVSQARHAASSRSPRPAHSKGGMSPTPAARKAAAVHQPMPARVNRSRTQTCKVTDVRMRIYKELWNFVAGREVIPVEHDVPARRRSSTKSTAT